MTRRVLKLSVSETINLFGEIQLPYKKQRKLRKTLWQLDRNIFASEHECRYHLNEIAEALKLKVERITTNKLDNHGKATDEMIEFDVVQVEDVYEVRITETMKTRQ